MFEYTKGKRNVKRGEGINRLRGKKCERGKAKRGGNEKEIR